MFAGGLCGPRHAVEGGSRVCSQQEGTVLEAGRITGSLFQGGELLMGGLNSGLCVRRTSIGAWPRKLLLVLCVRKEQVLHRGLEDNHGQCFKLREVCADSPATVVNVQKLATLRLRRDNVLRQPGSHLGKVSGAGSGALVQVLGTDGSEGTRRGAAAAWPYRRQFQTDTGSQKGQDAVRVSVYVFLNSAGCALDIVNKSRVL